MFEQEPKIGSEDGGFWCRVALRTHQFWNWVDERQIDAHLYSLAILYGTYFAMRWCMHYADLNAGRPGLEVAAVIGAVMAPVSVLQSAAIKFLFEARQGTFRPKG